MITTTTAATDQQDQAFAALDTCRFGFLDRLALVARLLAALLAREVLLVLLHGVMPQLLQVSDQACLSTCHDSSRALRVESLHR